MHSALPLESLRSRKLAWLIAAGAMAIGVSIVYAFDPSTARFYPPCVFHSLTGLQCPGCGGTRALHALLVSRGHEGPPPEFGAEWDALFMRLSDVVRRRTPRQR